MWEKAVGKRGFYRIGVDFSRIGTGFYRINFGFYRLFPRLPASSRINFFCEAEPVTFAATAVLTDAMFPSFLDRDGGV